MLILLLCLLQEDQTPLHIASRLGKTEIVQLLLQHMAHPDAATTNGYTPLHISAREGQVETASVLLEAGASHSLATKVGGGAMFVLKHHYSTQEHSVFTSEFLNLISLEPKSAIHIIILCLCVKY